MTKDATPREVGLSEGLGPLLAEADMDALKAVAEQAGLNGVDLRALARVLDAAQRVAVAAERERWSGMVQEFVDFLEPMRFDRRTDDAKAAALDKRARALLQGPNVGVEPPRAAQEQR